MLDTTQQIKLVDVADALRLSRPSGNVVVDGLPFGVGAELKLKQWLFTCLWMREKLFGSDEEASIAFLKDAGITEEHAQFMPYCLGKVRNPWGDDED